PVFGLIIAVVSCQQGMRTTGGAVGVGKSTTNAVVISMVGVYVADFLLARLMR
ncbi:ABC transporter permease, partial [bacterium]